MAETAGLQGILAAIPIVNNVPLRKGARQCIELKYSIFIYIIEVHLVTQFTGFFKVLSWPVPLM